MADFNLYIGEDGTIEHVYDDALADLFEQEGEVVTTRASHVEPAPGGWTADMGPVHGPVLGPFRTRAEALAAEHAWLDDQMQQREV